MAPKPIAQQILAAQNKQVRVYVLIGTQYIMSNCRVLRELFEKYKCILTGTYSTCSMTSGLIVNNKIIFDD